MTRIRGAGLGIVLLAALVAPPQAVAQDLAFWLASHPGQVLFKKRIDRSTPLIAKALIPDIQRSLAAANVDATPSDVEAIAQAVAAQATVWQDIKFHKFCDKSPWSVSGRAPSGAFTYVLECRDCRPRTC